MMLIAPAKAFCPNLLAAGPLMTSILSIELRSMGIFRELWAVWESFICIPFSKISTCPNVPPLSEMSDCTPWGPRLWISNPENCCKSSSMFLAGEVSISFLVMTSIFSETFWSGVLRNFPWIRISSISFSCAWKWIIFTNNKTLNNCFFIKINLQAANINYFRNGATFFNFK